MHVLCKTIHRYLNYNLHIPNMCIFNDTALINVAVSMNATIESNNLITGFSCYESTVINRIYPPAELCTEACFLPDRHTFKYIPLPMARGSQKWRKIPRGLNDVRTHL